MRKFCTFHAQEGHATEECERNNPSWRKNVPLIQEALQGKVLQKPSSVTQERGSVTMDVSSVTSSVTKQDRWKRKNPNWKAHRKAYMQRYRANKHESSELHS